MVAVVADDVVVTVDNLTDDAAVHGETCCKAECLVLADKLGKLLLELNMYVEGAIQETASGTTAAVLLHGSTACIDDALVASQACICVRTKHQYASTFHDDLGTLLSLNLTEVRVNTLRHKLLRECVAGAFLL